MSTRHEISPKLSVVLPVCQRYDDLSAVIPEYVQQLEKTGLTFEVVVVVDGPKMAAMEGLSRIEGSCPSLRVVQLSRSFGESAAMTVGFDLGKGEMFLTLPACYQIDPAELPKLIACFEDRDDLLVAVRSHRSGSVFDKIRRRFFHGIFRMVTGLSYHDLSGTVRLARRKVVEETPLYGDQHRFYAAMASRQGFRVREIELQQSDRDQSRRAPPLRAYVHRLLDILTIFFLIRFTKKPLRFFGMIGTLVSAVGAIVIAVLVVQRLFFGEALADRPALLLSSLLVVLGVQIFALGLIGELVIFTHAGQLKEYAIRAIIDSSSSDTSTSDAA
jgi:glycosyltransferase involved in cell wall biosynthesis